MLYLIEAPDRPGALETRIALRQRHIDYWLAANAVKIGGAMMNGDTEAATPCGSFLIVEAPSLDAARALLEGDPFMDGGVFAPGARITRFRPGLGTWNGD